MSSVPPFFICHSTMKYSLSTCTIRDLGGPDRESNTMIHGLQGIDRESKIQNYIQDYQKMFIVILQSHIYFIITYPLDTIHSFRWFLFLLAFDFCRFCVVIRFFSSPPQRPMTSDFEGFTIPDFIHYINFLFTFLILEKEPIFSLLNVQC